MPTFAEAAQLGLSAPHLAETASGVRLSIALAQQPPLSTSAPAVSPDAASTATLAVTTQQESRLESQPESRPESKLAAKVFLQLREQELGKAALARGLSHRSVSGELHKQISRLLEQDLIAMTLPDKPNSRLQRYRLTSQGQALLAGMRTSENPAP